MYFVFCIFLNNVFWKFTSSYVLDPASSSKNRDQNNSASSAASLNEKEGKEEIEENFKVNISKELQ